MDGRKTAHSNEAMQIYEQIKEIVPPLHGWCSVEKAVTLATIVLANKPTTLIECGVWSGRSAIPIMLALRENGIGRLICVDPWSPDESIKGQTGEDKEWWSSVANHELVYQQFVYHVKKLGLEDYCEIHRLPSEKFDPPTTVHLAHIDGNHGPQAYSDTVKISKAIPLWGVCVLDDLDWSGGHVRRSEAWLVEKGFLCLHPLGTGAVYQRTR